MKIRLKSVYTTGQMRRTETILLLTIIILSLFYYIINWSKVDHAIRNIRQFITTKSVDNYLLKLSINQPQCNFYKSYIKGAVKSGDDDNLVFVDLTACRTSRLLPENILINNRKIDSIDLIIDEIQGGLSLSHLSLA